MSRTYKDLPYRIKQLRKMKDGYFEHGFDHHFWTITNNQNKTYTRIEKVAFYKKDSAAIFAYRNTLDEEGFEYTIEEEAGYPLTEAVYNERRSYYTRKVVGYEPKKIVFHIEVEYERKRVLSDKCIEIENFVPHDFLDKSNGKMASCVPDVYSYDKKEYRAGWGYGYDKIKRAKTSRNADLIKIAKAYNTLGEDYDELMGQDSFVKDEVIYEEIESNVWWD